MRVLVIGRNGQVARTLARRAPEDFDLVLAGRETFDLTIPTAIPARLAEAAPDAVINAGAYTAVDKAESDVDIARAMNAEAPGALASLCAVRNIPLVHISTDYVFDGTKSAPYVETDPIAPINVYGAAKAEGEKAILATGANAAILRTSWVYSYTGANFVRTMLRLAATKDELGVIADQIGRPTWASDLADACFAATRALAAGQASAAGVFNYCGADDATWADFAEAIFTETPKHGLPSARVRRISTAEYPTPAKRPANSRLDTTKIEKVLGLKPRPLDDAIARCLAEIAAQPA
ncbi:MAG: dTDP-4-dehydrorhamnose reductase [Terricaulis silvestris]